MGATRDQGLVMAIRAAGGVGALARGLGIAQPSVSGWTRIPAERVSAVERLTGIGREHLRPDLFATPGRMAQRAASRGEDAVSEREDIDDIDRARAQYYLLLATLLREPPGQETLAAVSGIVGDASPLGVALTNLAGAARATAAADAGREFFNLFIGVGRGELLPYASFYRTGFLNERPLARVREDLGRLGIARADGVYEPEDHIATLLETMAGLILGEREPADAEREQQAFFSRHIAPWALRLFADMSVAQSAKLYKHVAEVGGLWIEIEQAAFALPA